MSKKESSLGTFLMEKSMREEELRSIVNDNISKILTPRGEDGKPTSAEVLLDSYTPPVDGTNIEDVRVFKMGRYLRQQVRNRFSERANLNFKVNDGAFNYWDGITYGADLALERIRRSSSPSFEVLDPMAIFDANELVDPNSLEPEADFADYYVRSYQREKRLINPLEYGDTSDLEDYARALVPTVGFVNPDLKGKQVEHVIKGVLAIAEVYRALFPLAYTYNR